jgi:hypothetical protein
MKKHFLFIVFLFSCLCIKTFVIAQNNKSYPIADGTFIQNDLIASWSDDRWQLELKALKDVGMHYIIIAPTLHTEKGINESMYPSALPDVKQKYKSDLVDNCLRNAAKAGFKVFLGLNLNEEWWNGKFTYEWLNHQMELGNNVADELTKKYKAKYGDVMYCWYWVWEVDNAHCSTPQLQDALASILNVNLDHLHAITPSMPFMLCPFMNYRLGTADENRRMWERVFAGAHFNKGDIFAPQDCIGAGGLKLDTLDVWFREMKKAVDTKSGLLFWSDAETFDQRFWTIAPLNRFINQMEIVKPYVGNIISFAYSHYYSPYKVNKKYHEAYLKYVRTGALPEVSSLGSPADLQWNKDVENKVLLTWKTPADSSEIAGYYIFRNGELVANIQNEKKRRNTSRNAFLEKKPLERGTYQYELCSYSFTGATSEKKGVKCEIN